MQILYLRSESKLYIMVYADLNLVFNSHHKSHANIYEDKKYISKNHLKKNKIADGKLRYAILNSYISL